MYIWSLWVWQSFWQNLFDRRTLSCVSRTSFALWAMRIILNPRVNGLEIFVESNPKTFVTFSVFLWHMTENRENEKNNPDCNVFCERFVDAREEEKKTFTWFWSHVLHLSTFDSTMSLVAMEQLWNNSRHQTNNAHWKTEAYVTLVEIRISEINLNTLFQMV